MSTKRLHEPLVVFGYDDEIDPKLIGFVTYAEDLKQDGPDTFVLDKQEKRLSLIFKSGYKEMLAPLDDDNIRVVDNILEQVKVNQDDLVIGLYRYGPEGDLIKPSYNVGVTIV
jgi:hypothetical protein